MPESGAPKTAAESEVAEDPSGEADVISFTAEEAIAFLSKLEAWGATLPAREELLARGIAARLRGGRDADLEEFVPSKVVNFANGTFWW